MFQQPPSVYHGNSWHMEKLSKKRGKGKAAQHSLCKGSLAFWSPWRKCKRFLAKSDPADFQKASDKWCQLSHKIKGETSDKLRLVQQEAAGINGRFSPRRVDTGICAAFFISDLELRAKFLGNIKTECEKLHEDLSKMAKWATTQLKKFRCTAVHAGTKNPPPY